MRLGFLLIGGLLFVCAPVVADDLQRPPLAATTEVSSNGESLREPRSFASQLVYDTKYIFTAPTRWDSDGWTQFGLAAATVLGAAILADKPERDPIDDRENRIDKLAKKLEPFGGSYSAVTLAGFYGIGKLTNSPKAMAVGEDGLTASLIASGLISGVTKVVVGRTRPSNTSDKTDFHPFSGDHSFPSGHTTQAFTVASVVSAHYDSPWVSTVSYTVASLVGYARHEHNAHWTSDIVAGAAIGLAVGHTVVKLNEDNRGARMSAVIGESGPMMALMIPLK